MDRNVKTIKLTTPHFEATVNVLERTFTIFGDFRVKDVYKIPPGEWRWYDSEEPRILQGLIDELSGLENTIRNMMPEGEVENDGVRLRDLPEE